ncbi:MAG: aminopeptidase [Gammaproteobacteria bacterium]|nr:aminopeptidase [Gammaproteobacteria bacterium]
MKFRLFLFGIVLLLNLNACSMIGYYQQSISGHLKLWWAQEAIDDVINHPATSVQLVEKLQTAKLARRFAVEQLALPDNKSYLKYADLKREYVVWNVYAAEEFSIDPHRWCYFIVGCVSYRGYYAQNDAREKANELKQQGFDTTVEGVAAYSTLGWFNDPLLNTMMHWSETSLVGLIFHELSHQVLYFPGDAAFNEAFASAVQRIGVIKWLQQNNPQQLENYYAYLSRQQDFRQLLLDTREQLNTLYNQTLADEEKRKQKQKIFTALRIQHQQVKTSRWNNYSGYDQWFAREINNARLSSNMTYLELIPAFYALFEQSHGNFVQFFNRVKQMSELEKNARKQQALDLVKTAPSLLQLVQKNLI